MSQPIYQKIKDLKASIFQITSHHTVGVRAKQDLAFSVFVKFSLGVMLNQLIERYRHYGITDTELAEHIYIDDTHFSLDEKLFGTLNIQALATSVRLYKEVVEALPAFSDVLMKPIEEIGLDGKKGDGLGQFLTPPDLANLLDELINTDAKSEGPRTAYRLYEACSGAGSLVLPKAMTKAIEGRHRTRLIDLEMHDLDPFMCCAAALQFVSSIVVHEQDLHQLRVTCSNALTETKPHSKSMIVIKTPKKLFRRVMEAHNQRIQQTIKLYGNFNSLSEKVLNKSKHRTISA